MLHSFKNNQNCWLQNAMSLSAKSLAGGGHICRILILIARLHVQYLVEVVVTRLKNMWGHNRSVSKSGNCCCAWCSCLTSSMLSPPFCNHIRAGSTDWHASQLWMTDPTAFFDMGWSTLLMKYIVHLTPVCQLN